MDCSQAQAYLKFSTLDHEATPDRDTLALKRHLATCESCCRAFESQRQFDLEIAGAMSSVQPPAGMKDRLRDVFSNVADQPAPARVSGRRFSRRLALGVAAASLLFGAWFAIRVAPLTEADVQNLAELDINSLPAASPDSFTLPGGWERVRAIRFSDVPRVASIGSRAILMMPVVVNRHSGSGFLVRLSEFKSQRPIESSFTAATVQYASFGSWVVWREGGAVYLCVIRDAQLMERLRHAIANSRDLT